MHTLSHVISASPYPMPIVIPVVCPNCRREGNFDLVGQDMVFAIQAEQTPRMLMAGHRMCPNSNCATHVFVVYEMTSSGSKLISSYPAGRPHFDNAGVPLTVTKAFEEALTCAEYGCHIAAAMLIRKTLEAVCKDRSAKGSDLKARISDLKTKVTLPNELFEAMDHLRLLGNDAAHIEAKNYDGVGEEEVAAGIELAKEIIKATYQYKGLLGKLKALQKS